VALFLVVLFVVFGLAALRQSAIASRWVNVILALGIVAVGVYSAAVIWTRRDGKPWTTLWASKSIELIVGGSSVTLIPPDGSQGIVVHVHLTIRNSSSTSVVIRHWKLEYEIAGKRFEMAPMRALKDEPVRRGNGVTMLIPYASQDLIDRVEAITKEHPAVGILNFELKGTRKEDMWMRPMKLTAYDDQNVAYASVWIRLVREENEGDPPIHLNGIKEVEQQPGSAPIELLGTITNAIVGHPIGNEHGSLYVLVGLSLLNTGTRPTSVYKWEGRIEIAKGKFDALPMAAPTKKGVLNFGGEKFRFDQNLIKTASKAIPPGGEPIEGWVLMTFSQLTVADYKYPVKVCVRLREIVRDTPYDACMSPKTPF
jgi:hypothetical protein